MTVKWNGPSIAALARQGAARGVVSATEIVRSEAISLILDGPKTGRVYRRRSVEHRASAPGEAPASDTGRLVNSIRTDFDLGALVGKVIASTAYAAYLEYGTAKMEARPYMRPALARKRKDVEATIAAAVRSALGGV